VVRLLASQQQQEEDRLDLSALYAGELNPVGPKAQKKVPVPEGLGKYM
jgi:AP-3 complex subunit delta-1